MSQHMTTKPSRIQASVSILASRSQYSMIGRSPSLQIVFWRYPVHLM